jgi:hypothetical protein
MRLEETLLIYCALLPEKEACLPQQIRVSTDTA